MTLFLLSAFLSHSMTAKILLSVRCSVSRLSALVPWSTGLPSGSAVKKPPAVQETQVQSLGQKIPWRKEWLPTPQFLPGEAHGQRRLVGYSPEGCRKSDTTDATEHARTREPRLFSPCPSSPLPSSIFVLSVPFYCIACSLPDPDLFFSRCTNNHPVK